MCRFVILRSTSLSQFSLCCLGVYKFVDVSLEINVIDVKANSHPRFLPQTEACDILYTRFYSIHIIGLFQFCLIVCKYKYAKRSSASHKTYYVFLRCRKIKKMHCYVVLRMQRMYTILYCVPPPFMPKLSSPMFFRFAKKKATSALMIESGDRVHRAPQQRAEQD